MCEFCGNVTDGACRFRSPILQESCQIAKVAKLREKRQFQKKEELAEVINHRLITD